jgi:hypothetical protein
MFAKWHRLHLQSGNNSDRPTMNPNKAELITHFQQLSDDELRRRCQSGALTELAQEVAQQELQARKLASSNKTPLKPEEQTDIASPENRPNQDASGEFATVASFSTGVQAHVLRAQLESEGLFAVVRDEHLVGANHLWSTAVGGVRVDVPRESLAQAQEIMQATKEGIFSLPQDDEPQPEKLAPREAALLAYAGSKEWLKIWQGLIKQPGFFAGFNFGGFFLGALWCAYRKMYLLALIVYGVEMAALFKFGILWPMLATRGVLALCGYSIYFMQAQNAVDQWQRLPEAEMHQKLKAAGGISVGAVLAILGFHVFLLFISVPASQN